MKSKLILRNQNSFHEIEVYFIQSKFTFFNRSLLMKTKFNLRHGSLFLISKYYILSNCKI